MTRRMMIVGSLTMVAVAALVIADSRAVDRRKSDLAVRLARITEEEQKRAADREAARQREAAEAVAAFPERRDVITSLFARFDQALNQGDRVTMGQAMTDLRAMLEPVFISEIANRTDVIAFRQPYARVKNLMELAWRAEDHPVLPSIGDTWDEALPKLNTGVRIQFGFDGPDRAVETRRFGSDTYRLTFERTAGGPLRLARIQPQ